MSSAVMQVQENADEIVTQMVKILGRVSDVSLVIGGEEKGRRFGTALVQEGSTRLESYLRPPSWEAFWSGSGRGSRLEVEREFKV